MAGKFIAAVVAAAVTSASAATVGVVYTRIVGPDRVESSGPTAGGAGGPLKSAVVLNASEGLFESFGGSASDSEAPACSSVSDSQHCGAGVHGSDVRLNILGSTLTILPIWLGGDSEDRYADRGNTRPLPTYVLAEPAEVLVRLSHRHASFKDSQSSAQSDEDTGEQSGAERQSGSQNQSNSQRDGNTLTGGASTPSPRGVAFQGAGASRSPNDVSDLLLVMKDGPDLNPLSEFSPIDAAPAAEPLIGYSEGVLPPSPADSNSGGPGPSTPYPNAIPGSAGAVPEPSTWVMMIAGFAGLCVLKRRRIAAALRSARV